MIITGEKFQEFFTDIILILLLRPKQATLSWLRSTKAKTVLLLLNSIIPMICSLKMQLQEWIPAQKDLAG